MGDGLDNYARCVIRWLGVSRLWHYFSGGISDCITEEKDQISSIVPFRGLVVCLHPINHGDADSEWVYQAIAMDMRDLRQPHMCK